MTSTLPPIVQAFSGAIGSATANAISYPLDLVTTRLQTTKSKNLHGIRGAITILRYTVKKYGVIALYDGLNSDSASTVLSNFLYFYMYSFLRSLLIRRSSNRSSSKTPILSVPRELSIGFIAGVASRFISSPLSIITVRLQTEREGSDDELREAEDGEGEKINNGTTADKGLYGTAKSIYAEETLAGFWKGFESTILLSLNPSLTFSFFQLYRQFILRGKRKQMPSPLQAFLGAAFANSLAVTILYPLIIAKTRLQLANSESSGNSRLSIRSVLHDAYTQRSGFPGGLYQGLDAQVIKGFLSQGITLMVKQRIEQVVVAAALSFQRPR
ncbi:mitochondrial carrier protein [Heterobasidion irregulare TC 32-1]|uniref:Mitochondrial carrier protein n=1 Tax=Heterobasidion irregulare (strain TC 32-1) TaxID=747525 RepID=W4JNW4_HETIT|nr:mitochondrial carrier protein [Heterobasidion irregulare TC 32-1]ETW74755.1 mitochondrial carrier protein [Heterobasidion irregulare TC 32-1]